jgi:hypothetical protein
MSVVEAIEPVPPTAPMGASLAWSPRFWIALTVVLTVAAVIAAWAIWWHFA